MVSRKDANKARLKRHKRVRAKISGTAARPRLCVYRSNANAFMRPWNNTLPQCMMVTGSIQRSHSGPYPRHARFSTDGPSALSLSLACMMPGRRKKSPLSISMALSFCLSCQFAFVSSPQTAARTAWPMRKRWHQMPPQMHPQPQRLRSSAPPPPGY